MPHEMLLPLTNFHPSLTSKQFNLFPTPLPRTPKFLIRSCASTSASASASDAQTRTLPKSAIQRITDKLRTLGFTEDAPTPIPNPETGPNENAAGEIFIPLPDRLPKRRVGYTMDTSWSSPENPVPKPGTGSAIARYNALRREVTAQKVMERKERKGNKEERAPTLAELSLSEGELRRLRKIGIEMTKKLKVGKAGITEGIVNGIHERWRSSEVVKIVCEDLCRMNMKRTHDLLERKTGGLVVWRSGSKIVLYRGANYKYPYFLSDESGENDNSTDALSNLSMDEGGHNKKESCTSSINDQKSTATSPSEKMSQQKLIQGVGMPNRVRFQLPGEAQLADEADCLLEGLGPRYTDWWGYDPLPVDADLLPAIVPGYRKPFRLLPYGVKTVLTNDEMTILKRLGRPLPCHFVLSRNRNLQGLATSILKLWEKCEIAKIAVKRGVQNTNSEMMAEELKRLTGGILLSRDSEFFVLYRGKDFLPPAVSSAIEARRKDGINGEKERTTAQKFKFGTTDRDSENDVGGANDEERGLSESDVGGANEEERGLSESDVVGANEEERGLLSEERKLGSKDAAIKRTSIKLSMAIEKKAKAEKILAELETSENLEAPEIDKEGITEEERYMLRKVGLRMRAFLLMGRRGVFDGTIENMHLHWKYREIVKIISKGRNIKVVHQEAQILEAESGGILVAVERVNKGYAIIMYRGKNYKRPACLRPQTLLNKREAMKRSIEAQRRKSLKLHVLKLTKNIDELKLELVKDEEANNKQSADELRYKFVKEDMDGMQQAEYLTSQANPNSGPVIPACIDENTEVKVTHKAHSIPMKLNDGIDVSISSLQAPQQELPIGPSTKPEEDGTGKVGGSSSESVREETRANMFKDMDSEVGPAVSASCPDNLVSEGMSCPAVVRNKATTSPVKPAKIVSEPVPVKVENGLKVNHRATQLSNKERLLLRKQALKMKKRPVLAVGRSNTVAGVAKTIMVHFKKHPLAIVNVKGRATGTSVQEVVFQLEQATGAVLVSQEPSKVILYRGWGAGDKPGHLEQKNASDPGKEGKTRPTVSAELLAAIRLECGLDGHNKEEVTV